MWLTGFDAPSCSTIYLDKPMRNHTLMQTIARANRVYPGKHSGTIVDYANVFASLERALAIYAQGRGVDLAKIESTSAEKFEALIEAYNSGSCNIDEIFKDLVALAGVLTQEQERHVREHLREEELTIFDILTRPGPKLSTEEREEVKKVARQLLERLNALLVLGWRQKIQSRAKIHLAIEDTLEGLPRAYTKDLFAKKSEVLFEHVYEAYAGEGKSVFNQTA